ncbi:MAG: hypothetical protein Greene071421_253 [Parcubacteria group bacterium Greene0714_21]|nr:MAG: hypothetical protein Greene101447_466 [Parcubacteria group bacterium Greene1014_47]TSD04417.1 MAG: hypothetical protein Greene071421_253 [Parcubacteria group bacterium Greene0714_21]
MHGIFLLYTIHISYLYYISSGGQVKLGHRLRKTHVFHHLYYTLLSDHLTNKNTYA